MDTVGELIEELKQYDPNQQVRINDIMESRLYKTEESVDGIVFLYPSDHT